MAYGALAAIIISLVAGLATVVGGGISILAARHITPITFAAALAFAAGCTLTVAFADVLPEGQEAFNDFLCHRNHAIDGECPDDGSDRNAGVGLLVMLVGWLLATMFDKALHSSLDAYEYRRGAGKDRVIHVGVCAHDHEHKHQRHQDSPTGLTAPIMHDPLNDSHNISLDIHDSQHDSQDDCVPHSHDQRLESASAESVARISSSENRGCSGRCFCESICKACFRLVVSKSTLTEQEQLQLERQFRSEPEKISRLGYFTATVLALHNLPEGIALYGTATANTKAGLGLAAGIALHNLPQGMAIAVPIFVGMKSGWKAILFCSAAALAQPLGAILGYAIVGASPSDRIMSVMLLLTAGVLFNASLKELYGSAVRYDKGNQVSGSFMFIGMLVMSATLIVLAFVSLVLGQEASAVDASSACVNYIGLNHANLLNPEQEKYCTELCQTIISAGQCPPGQTVLECVLQSPQCLMIPTLADDPQPPTATDAPADSSSSGAGSTTTTATTTSTTPTATPTTGSTNGFLTVVPAVPAADGASKIQTISLLAASFATARLIL